MGKRTSTWKATERRVAAQLGGRRMGPGVDRADVRCDWLTAEVKHRKLLPAWLLGALDQARQYSTESQLPVAVLHRAGDRIADSVVCMRLHDFVAWHGAIPESWFTEAERNEVGPIPF
jgi:hypothetical protein